MFEGDDGFLMNVDHFTFSTTIKIGDVDGNGVVGTADLTAVRRHLLTEKSLNVEQAVAADLDGDQKITAADMSLLKRILLK